MKVKLKVSNKITTRNYDQDDLRLMQKTLAGKAALIVTACELRLEQTDRLKCFRIDGKTVEKETFEMTIIQPKKGRKRFEYLYRGQPSDRDRLIFHISMCERVLVAEVLEYTVL